MSTPPTTIDLPLRETSKTLLLDLRVTEVGRKLHRNVLVARNAIVPPANFTTEQTLRILRPATANPGTSHVLQGTPGNTVTVMCSTAPVQVKVTRDTGIHDLGLQTLLVLSSPILQLELVNNDVLADVDVEIIHA